MRDETPPQNGAHYAPGLSSKKPWNAYFRGELLRGRDGVGLRFATKEAASLAIAVRQHAATHPDTAGETDTNER